MIRPGRDAAARKLVKLAFNGTGGKLQASGRNSQLGTSARSEFIRECVSEIEAKGCEGSAEDREGKKTLKNKQNLSGNMM